jgi:hypothetical protein
LSIWPFMFDNERFQRRDIQVLKSEVKFLAEKERGGASATQYQLDQLRDEVAELALFNKALLRLMIDKGVFTPGEFEQTFRELDREDGVEDGKLTEGGKSERCSKCQRPVPRTRKDCQMCGADAPWIKSKAETRARKRDA